MSRSRRRREPSPIPRSRRHRSRSKSPLRHHHLLRSRSRSRSPPSSRPPRPAPVFPSHHDYPNLPPEIRLLCDILSTTSPTTPSHVLLSRLDSTGIRVIQSDVETVLRLSYSHPAPALTFFRWAGDRCLSHDHSPYSWNLVVDILGKNRLFDTMWDTVRSMRDLEFLSFNTFRAIFEALAADGRAGEALAAFLALPMYSIPRDTAALNSLLAALCRFGLLEDARAVLHESVQIGVRLDADSFQILLEGCENEKDAKCAQKVFVDMVITIGWNPINWAAYDSFLVTVLSSPENGFLEAMKYLKDLHRRGCSPGPKFFCTALQLCHMKSDVQTAIFLWEGYIKYGVGPPDTSMYNCIIALFCKERQLEAAMRYFNEMVSHGAFPDPDTYNMLFQMLIKARKERDAIAVLNEMLKNGCLPTHANCLLAFDTKNLELCDKVWQCMLKHGIHPLEEAGNLVVSLLEGLDLLPEACKCAEELIDYGVKLTCANLANLKRSLNKIHKEYIYDNLLSKLEQLEQKLLC